MKHMDNETKRNSKFNKVISLIAVAAVFTMVGSGIGAYSTRSALAEADQTEVSQTVDETASAGDYSTSPAVAVYEKCADSVVGVITSSQQWNIRTQELEQEEIGEGSGVVISDEGYILTNNHVVEEGSYYEVLLSSGERVPATLVGTDSGTDIAVLKVEGQTLTAIEIGSSSELKVGETVIAIGNPGGSVFANTVTQGIVSGLERDLDDAFTRTVKTIQHDAAINPGNSGGALLNTRGQLVGINTLKYTGSSYSSTTYEGLGFAIPIDTIMPLAEQIIEYGEVRRPALGVTCGTFSGPDEPIDNYPPASVVITEVTEGGPADEAGIKALDFITEVNGVRITSLNDLTALMDTMSEGDTVSVTVLRYDNTNTLLALLNSLGYNLYSSGGMSGYYGGYNTSSRLTYEELTFDVTLEILSAETSNVAETAESAD